MLTLKNIVYTAEEGKHIINDISINVPSGSITVITGPNGGGKTSLAKIISGLYTPTSGSVILNGTDVTNLNVTERAKAGISYAFQHPVRFKGITVKDMLELSAGKEMSYSMLCELLGQVGLCANEYINRELNSSLSGGEMKRIEIAGVLARGTMLNVFDEPEAGIDLWSFTKLVETFEELKGKSTLVIISHQERILNIADKIIVVADGKITKEGTKEEILPGLFTGGIDCPFGLSSEE